MLIQTCHVTLPNVILLDIGEQVLAGETSYAGALYSEGSSEDNHSSKHPTETCDKMLVTEQSADTRSGYTPEDIAIPPEFSLKDSQTYEGGCISLAYKGLQLCLDLLNHWK